MASSRQIECTSTAAAEATLAKALAPEDVRPGDFVTPLFVITEMPSFWWNGGCWNLPHDQPVRIRLTYNCDGMPMRVKSVCLPFVLAKSPAGEQNTIDLRKCQIARLDQGYAKRPVPVDDIWLNDSDIVLVPKTPIQQVDEVIDQYITRGVYSLLPREVIWNLNSTGTSL